MRRLAYPLDANWTAKVWQQPATGKWRGEWEVSWGYRRYDIRSFKARSLKRLQNKMDLDKLLCRNAVLKEETRIAKANAKAIKMKWEMWNE